jgi:ABC-2 type transport system permease protein
MNTSRFSFKRLWAVVVKEFIQMRRDRLTFGMMVGIPMIQLMLFGFAINSDPKHLPTAIIVQDHSQFSRTFVWSLRNSRYFDVVVEAESEREVQFLLDEGEVQFVINIPADFSRDLLRGERPRLLLQAAINNLVANVFDRDLKGPLQKLRGKAGPVEMQIHRHYNQEGKTQYNIVPGLMGVVLTMTMIVITALAITRERERGTMENLLATPARPAEVMFGKIIPYIMVGYIQTGLILVAAKFLFNVPMLGSIPLLLALMLVFIAANLAVGITFSTIAKNQLQAMQMSFFFFLPSILLSGFMFPFRGMPEWAQHIGSALPLTHFLRLVRGILLKGNDLNEAATHIWPIALFMVVVMTIGIKRYRQTLD